MGAWTINKERKSVPHILCCKVQKYQSSCMNHQILLLLSLAMILELFAFVAFVAPMVPVLVLCVTMDGCGRPVHSWGSLH